jgi:hypothetical protein
MRTWRGPSIIGIALLHTAFTLVVASGVLFDAETLASVGGVAPLAQMTPGFGSAQPPKIAALTFFWSIFFGLALTILGVLVRDLEQREQPIPHLAGWLLLAMGVLGGILVPVSGFWLVLPAAWSITRRG